MAKKRRVSEIVEAVRECQRLHLEAELTPFERRRANWVLEGPLLPTFQGEASALGEPLGHRRPLGGLGSASHG
ncbi:hypothetical protein [Deinococcus sp. YIM 77859]|uniref:hypothetical protein n=1 Tax=Deinococcus sp. YIM 77859 TaxID=1540221 RepID=UPI00054EE1D4|nr:hypothetical protein [Deinococcus sp. YIM 77859]